MAKRKLLQPTRKRQASIPVEKPQDQFWGMHNGIPGSEVDLKHSLKNVNVIDRRKFFSVRKGTEPYTSVLHGASCTLDAGTDLMTTTFPLSTGDEVWFEYTTAPGVSGGYADFYTKLSQFRGWYVRSAGGNTYTLHGDHFEANWTDITKINITSAGAGVKVHRGPINSRIVHEGKSLIVWHIGYSVYVTDLNMTSFTRVVNNNAYHFPMGESSMAIVGEDVVLGTISGIFKIYLDPDNSKYHMDRVNGPCPTQIIRDIPEVVSEDKIWGYHVVYSWAHLTGDLTSKRTNANVEVLHESGTSIIPGGQAKDYGEVFYTSEISDDRSDPHVYGFLKVPENVEEATHFPIYRTLQIGEQSGGASETINGIGNRTDVLAWVDDAPVCKLYRFETLLASNVATVKMDDNPPSIHEIGCEIDIMDTSSPYTTVQRVITDVDENARTITFDGSALSGDYIAAIGHLEGLWTGSQTGDTVTVTPATIPLNDVFRRGTKIFWSSGKYATVTAVLGSGSFKVDTSETLTSLAVGFGPQYRRYNDTTVDDGKGTGKESLLARLYTQSDLYVPRRLHLPLPNADVIIAESGFLVTALRGYEWYRYSQYGDKSYHVGMYRPVIQEDKLPSPVNGMESMTFLGVIFMADKTHVLQLNVSSNAGRIEAGEVVSKLAPAVVADDYVGVVAYWTIAKTKGNMVFAITSEPAARYFDGQKWLLPNIAYDQKTGDNAVQKYYIDQMNTSTAESAAIVTEGGGLKLWFRK